MDSTALETAQYHVGKYGWPGIGYHFLIHWNGLVEYVGLLTTIRWNVAGLNNTIVGVCLLGNFMTHYPTPNQIVSARNLNTVLRDRLKKNLPILGHRDIAIEPTSCPGDTWPEWKKYIEPPS